ncbi:MAG: G-D-S-L family lipolytic protein, partial [Acidobacteriota bacterium]
MKSTTLFLSLLVWNLLSPIGAAAPAQPPARPAVQDTQQYDIPPTDEGLPGAGPIRRYDWFR